jgi:uncharacterized protein Yka (UPF0111/DUF47 family)
VKLTLKGVLRDLRGRSDQTLVDLVLGQIDAALEGARLAHTVVAGGELQGPRERMARTEHLGDELRARLVAELSGTLVTPIDREDLFRLSRSADDVLDNLRDFLREWELYGVEGGNSFGPLLEAVVEGLTELRGATRMLLDRPTEVGRGALASKKAGNEIRRLYQLETARLFERELSMDVLKRRELLRRLDVVGLRLGEAADYLADGSMKRGY